MKYIFRGHVILDFDAERKQFRKTEQGLDFCRVIEEDFFHLADYFATIEKFVVTGDRELLQDIVVN